MGEYDPVTRPDLETDLPERLDDSGLGRLLDLMPEAILAIDQWQRVRYFNRRSEVIFGYSAEEVLGRPLNMLLPEGARQAHQRLVDRFADSVGERQDINWRPSMRGQHKDGSDIPFNSTICRLEIDGAQYFAAVLHDIGGLKHTELALRRSEESYRDLIETSAQGMLIQQDLRIVLANQALAVLTGYEIAELLSMGLDDLRHPDDRVTALNRHSAAVHFEEYENTEERLRRKDGTTVWVQVHSRDIERQGRPARLITAIDISDRKRAEEEASRQRRYAATAERLAKVGSWGWQSGVEQSFWSDEFLRILGIAPGGIKPGFQGFLEFVHPDDRTRIESQRKLFISSGEWASEEVRIVRPDGEIRTVILQWEMLRGDNGQPVEAGGSIQDVTELRTAEADLRDSEKRFRDIAENTPLALLITRRSNGTILFANDRVETVLGLPAAQILGQDIKQFYWQPKDREATTSELDQNVQIDYRPLHMRHSDGRRIATRHFLRAVTYDGEEAILGAFEDVTERLELEERLRHAQKMEAVGQLTGGIAHDFNNLLAVIMGNLALLQEDRTITDNIRDLATSALASAERGANLTHRLLAFARRQPLMPRPTNLNDLIEGMGDLLRHSLNANIKVHTCMEADLYSCEIDASQMENAILNLAINGRDAMASGGTLSISTRNLDTEKTLQYGEDTVRPGRYVGLAVSDTGDGMSGEVLRQALDPFFSTKEVGRGSGLGLSMVYGFIRQSGGYLRLESAPGQGTTISMLLPGIVADG